jgi:hypothetical protein
VGGFQGRGALGRKPIMTKAAPAPTLLCKRVLDFDSRGIFFILIKNTVKT